VISRVGPALEFGIARGCKSGAAIASDDDALLARASIKSKKGTEFQWRNSQNQIKQPANYRSSAPEKAAGREQA
jgi:hypothetical protein